MTWGVLSRLLLDFGIFPGCAGDINPGFINTCPLNNGVVPQKKSGQVLLKWD